MLQLKFVNLFGWQIASARRQQRDLLPPSSQPNTCLLPVFYYTVLEDRGIQLSVFPNLGHNKRTCQLDLHTHRRPQWGKKACPPWIFQQSLSFNFSEFIFQLDDRGH